MTPCVEERGEASHPRALLAAPATPARPHQPGLLPGSRGGDSQRGPQLIWSSSPPPWAVWSHAHAVCAGGTVGAGLEQGEQQEERDAGCREHPCLRRGGQSPRPRGGFLPTHRCRAETGAWRRMLPKTVLGTRVGLAGPTGESGGVRLGMSGQRPHQKQRPGMKIRKMPLDWSCFHEMCPDVCT